MTITETTPRTSQQPQHLRRTLPALGAAALLALGVSLGTAAPALAHDELVSTEVVMDADAGTPESLVLTFSDVVLEVGTEIHVTGPDGSDATDGAPEHDARDVIQPLADDLAPGDYDVVWRVVSSDGHPIEGALSFDVTEGSSAATDASEGDSAGAESDPAQDESQQNDANAAEHTHDDTDAHETEDAEQGSVGVLTILLIAAGAVIVIGVTVLLTRRGRTSQQHAAADSTGGEGSPESAEELEDPQSNR